MKAHTEQIETGLEGREIVTFKDHVEDFVAGQQNFNEYAEQDGDYGFWGCANAMDQNHFEELICRGYFDDVEME